MFGSGRSVEGVDLIRTLQTIEKNLDRYGGHAMACGFSLKTEVSREQFQMAFLTAVKAQLDQLPETVEVPVAAELRVAEVTWDLVEQLEAMQPWGEDNEEPLFMLKDVPVKDFQPVGSTGKHIRLVVGDATHQLKAIAFGFGKKADTLQLGATVTLIGNIGVNEWNGHRDLQLSVTDWL